MKIFKKLLIIVFLFSWTATGQLSRHLNPLSVKKNIILNYPISEYLSFGMQQIQNVFESFWKRPLHEVPLKELLQKSEQGDVVSKLALTYLYLDKELKNQNGKWYAPFFSEKELTEEEFNSIRDFLRESSQPYEWYFIQGWLSYFSFWDRTHEKSERMVNLQKSFVRFLKAKEVRNGEFEFLWASFVIEMESHYNFGDSHIEEAKSIVLDQAKRGYAPAQYLQGIVDWRSGDDQSTLQWLKKAFENNFKRASCSAAIGLIYYAMGDFKGAAPYLELAVHEYGHEYLKPELMVTHYHLDQLSQSFPLAKEIGENYTKFPMEKSMSSIIFLMGFYFDGDGTEQDMERVYLWMKRLFYINQENGTSLEIKDEFLEDVKQRISPQKIGELDIKAALLHSPAKQYSEMEKMDPCHRTFH
ncbi:MAG: hypothetical protein OXB86_03745 [Bdellovibrionales bacterium]|nr:hypothetical protein [Bdellovibrionales bacterium]